MAALVSTRQEMCLVPSPAIPTGHRTVTVGVCGEKFLLYCPFNEQTSNEMKSPFQLAAHTQLWIVSSIFLIFF